MSYHTKYRPSEWRDVIGQDHAVTAMRRALTQKQSNTFLLTGPSGTGKTTLARLACKELDINDPVEIDAATNNGVDAMRDVMAGTRVQSFTGGGKAVILDECHRLSKQAWDSLLKDIEEPADNVYWFLCTTELASVPQTIRTRCLELGLRALSLAELRSILRRVRDEEALQASNEVIDVVVEGANGSPRKALTDFAKVSDVDEPQKAADLLCVAQAGPEAIDLARVIANKGFALQSAVSLVEGMKDANSEAVRITVFQYILAICLKEPSTYLAIILGEFERPIDLGHQRNKIGDILLRVMRVHAKKGRA